MGILQSPLPIHSHIPSSSRCLEPSGSLGSKGSCLVWCCCYEQSGWSRLGPFHELRSVVLVAVVVADAVALVVMSVAVEGVIVEVKSVVVDADDAGQHVQGEECRMPYIFGEREGEGGARGRAVLNRSGLRKLALGGLKGGE